MPGPRAFAFQTKALLLVALVVVAWWFTPAIFKRWTHGIFHEFQAPVWTSLSIGRDIRTYWSLRSHSKSELIEAGIDLARLNAAYALRNQRMDSLEREVASLESFLRLPPHPEFRYEVARVVKRDINTWWQTLTIRKGAHHGIAVGQPVVFAGGVVGRVQSVHAYTAVVELVSSPRFRTAAHFEADRRPVEFVGALNHGIGPASARVATVPADLVASPEAPLRLQSSSMGGVFPDGLTLGFVEQLDAGPDGLFQSGKVRLDPRLQELREVAVMVRVGAEGADGP